MAGSKDRAVVAVISNLTSNQSAQISKEIMRVKEKYAPLSRGTIAAGTRNSVGAFLQRGQKRLGGK